MEAQLVGGEIFHTERGPNIGLMIQVGDVRPRGYCTIERADDRDVIVALERGIPPDALRGSRDSVARLATLFADLALLAREDERLRALLARFQIEVTMGGERLWPPAEEAR